MSARRTAPEQPPAALRATPGGARNGAADCACSGAGELLATLTPTTPRYRPLPDAIAANAVVTLSRFCVVRRDPEAKRLVIESPLALARVTIVAPALGQLVARLAAGAPVERLVADLAAAEPGGGGAALDPAGVTATVALLLRAGLAGVTDERGRLAEDDDPALRLWDFHDLLFHARSRVGRSDEPLGANFRLRDTIPAPPAIKRAPWSATIALPRPDLDAVALRDPPLTAAIEARTSIRVSAAYPIGLRRLGEFLYRVGRVRTRVAGDGEELALRPYPGGGARYELEIYANVGDGAGVAAGLYWYDPAAHALCRVCEPDALTRALLRDAQYATGGLGRPQVLFVLAARFARVSWKYDAIAYATILKDTGVVFATMYLVATAMGLGPCALGAGDADLFARAAGTRYVEESSVGEFMLCGASTPAVG